MVPFTSSSVLHWMKFTWLGILSQASWLLTKPCRALTVCWASTGLNTCHRFTHSANIDWAPAGLCWMFSCRGWTMVGWSMMMLTVQPCTKTPSHELIPATCPPPPPPSSPRLAESHKPALSQARSGMWNGGAVSPNVLEPSRGRRSPFLPAYHISTYCPQERDVCAQSQFLFLKKRSREAHWFSLSHTFSSNPVNCGYGRAKPHSIGRVGGIIKKRVDPLKQIWYNRQRHSCVTLLSF